MAQLLPSGAGADGAVSFAAAVDPPLDQDIYVSGPSSMTQSNNLSFDSTEPMAEMDVNDLMQLGRDMFSTTPSIQSNAIDTSISTFKDIFPMSAHTRSMSSSGNRSFSDVSPYSRPPSSTDPSISKGKSKRRSAASLSNRSPSLSSSAAMTRRSRSSQAESSRTNAATLSGVAGVLSRATDCISNILDYLQPESPTECPKLSLLHEASAMLKKDDLFTPDVRGKFANVFISNKNLCEVYIEFKSDPKLRKSFVLNWYQEKYGQLPLEQQTAFSGSQAVQPSAEPAYTVQLSGQLPFEPQTIPGSQVVQPNTSYAVQSSGQMPPELPTTSFFSVTQALHQDGSYPVTSSSSGVVDESDMSYPASYNQDFLPYDQTLYDYNV
ncbi:hypothetical protein J3R83DRAFT_7834 [Lanmaoa asiatica]|nr:hypothetical protein J3R83DRAFT_7834 [Lanmaoa asiatica]